MSVSTGGDNIGLVWRNIYTSKQCQFEDVTIIHSTTASHALSHACLVSLLFMESLYSMLFLIYLSPFQMHGVQHNVQSIMPIIKGLCVYCLRRLFIVIDMSFTKLNYISVPSFIVRGPSINKL